MRWIAAALTAALLVTGSTSEARQHHPARGHRIVPASSAPLDGFTAPSGAYSFRKLKSSYSGPAIRIRRASDNAETDISFLGCTGFTGCPWDEAAATAHCAATSCFVTAWYDQSGLARDLVQATAANQPSLVFGCFGALPCLRTGVSTMQMAAASSVTPSTGVATISVVGNRSSGTGACQFFRQNGSTGNRIQGQNAAVNSWALGGAASFVLAAAPDAASHAAVGIINFATSSLTVDGTFSSGSITPSTTAAAPGLAAAGTTTCNHAEAVVWDAYQISGALRTEWIANQRSFWGF